MYPNKFMIALFSMIVVVSLAACGLNGSPQSARATPVPSQTQAVIAQPTSTTAASDTATPLPQPTDTQTAVPSTATATLAPSATTAPTQTPQPQPSVWVRNPNDKVLLKIDPATNSILAKAAIEGGITVLEATGNAIWAANKTTLYKLSPNDGQIIAKTTLTYPAVALAAGQDAIWVGMMVLPKDLTPGVEFSPSGKIARVNPDTAQITGTVDLSCSPKTVALGSSSVWVASGCFNLSVVNQIDPKTLQRTPISNDPNTPLDPTKLPASIGGNLAMSSAAAWMVSTDAATVYRIDPSNHKITQQSDLLKNYTATPVSMAVGNGQVWLALTDGKILGLDPASLSLLTMLDLKKQLTGVDFAFSQGAVWVNDTSNAVLTRIDPASKQVVASFSTGSAYATPTPLPPQAEAPSCSITIPTRLQTGGQAHVDPQSALANQVRKAAGSNFGILGQLQPGEVVDLLEGPVCADGWPWWKVKSEQTGLTGWTAEGNKTTYWLVPGK